MSLIPLTGYQINVTLSPAVSGISVQLWWVLGGVPALIIGTENTDSNGQVSFNPGASSYPVYMKVIVPAGQMIGGTEYGGAESGDLACYEGSVFNVSLTLSPAAAWEHLEFYRGIEIEVYMPDGTPYRAYYDGRWDVNYELADIKAGIDAFLDPPTVDTVITINGPATFDIDEPFIVYGNLYDAMGTPLGSLNVKLFADSTLLTQENTQSNGSYAFTITLPEPRNYLITASYGGTSAALTLNLKI